MTDDNRRGSLMPFLRDVAISFIVVAIVLGGLWAYAGMWPPMVVIESGSMQHSQSTSSVGIIDTGDLTLVRSAGKVDRIVTWAEGSKTGYSTYGNYGDVIVFHKSGLAGYTPIIHRAMVYIELNATTGSSFDVPEMGLYDVIHITLHGLRTYHTGREQVVDLPINLVTVLDNFRGVKAPHGGYLTKGDNNPSVDQLSLYWSDPPAGTPPRAEPVLREWIVGVSRGELPWFGVLKLWFSKQSQAVPDNSWYDLLLTVGLLIALPVLIDLTVAVVRQRTKVQEDEGGQGALSHASPPRRRWFGLRAARGPPTAPAPGPPAWPTLVYRPVQSPSPPPPPDAPEVEWYDPPAQPTAQPPVRAPARPPVQSRAPPPSPTPQPPPAPPPSPSPPPPAAPPDGRWPPGAPNVVYRPVAPPPTTGPPSARRPPGT